MANSGKKATMARRALLRPQGRASDWFRMGVFSATVLAPLVARWNDLRVAERAKDLSKDWGGLADEQTRELRRMAAARAKDLSELAAQRSQEWGELALARSNEWRDLAADRASAWTEMAGEKARILGDQALALSDDLLAVAAGRADDLRKQTVSRLEDARQQFLATKTYDTLKDTVPMLAKLDNRKSRGSGTRLWVIGAVVGLLAAGIAGFVILRRQLAAGPEEQLVELPQAGSRTGSRKGTQKDSNGTSSANREPLATEPGALSGLRDVARKQGIDSMSDIDTARDANAAPFIGNIHTKVYHDATDTNLPTEENRVYFASEDEARKAGYRPSRPTAVEHNETRSPRP
jgi:hypothetical protein